MVSMTTTTSPSGAPFIVGLGGSLGPSSTSLAALRHVLAKAEAAGARTRLLDVRTLDLPPFDPSLKEAPPAARDLADAMHAADAVVWSSPMYHGTVSGAFKNALDWLQLLADRKPAYLTNKPVALIATAAGAQGLQAINTMEFVVRALRGWTLPFVVPIAKSYAAFGPDGALVDETASKQLGLLAAEIVAAARRFGTPSAASLPLPLAVAQ